MSEFSNAFVTSIVACQLSQKWYDQSLLLLLLTPCRYARISAEHGPYFDSKYKPASACLFHFFYLLTNLCLGIALPQQERVIELRMDRWCCRRRTSSPKVKLQYVHTTKYYQVLVEEDIIPLSQSTYAINLTLLSQVNCHTYQHKELVLSRSNWLWEGKSTVRPSPNVNYCMWSTTNN